MKERVDGFALLEQTLKDLARRLAALERRLEDLERHVEAFEADYDRSE
jgi:hypothetical protein